MKTIQEIDLHEAYKGYVRYETLRNLKPRQFDVLDQRNMAGRNFDEMVDELSKLRAWNEFEQWFKEDE